MAAARARGADKYSDLKKQAAPSVRSSWGVCGMFCPAAAEGLAPLASTPSVGGVRLSSFFNNSLFTASSCVQDGSKDRAGARKPAEPR